MALRAGGCGTSAERGSVSGRHGNRSPPITVAAITSSFIANPVTCYRHRTRIRFLISVPENRFSFLNLQNASSLSAEGDRWWKLRICVRHFWGILLR